MPERIFSSEDLPVPLRADQRQPFARFDRETRAVKQRDMAEREVRVGKG